MHVLKHMAIRANLVMDLCCMVDLGEGTSSGVGKSVTFADVDEEEGDIVVTFDLSFRDIAQLVYAINSDSVPEASKF